MLTTPRDVIAAAGADATDSAFATPANGSGLAYPRALEVHIP